LLALAGNATLERVWRSLEPFSRTYITLVAPGADAHWTADLHPAILRALRTRDSEQVVAALRRHFDEASSHLAGGWDDERPALVPAARRTAHTPH
jgi:DNA-binding GntR family transcriptional regulator